MSRLSMIERPGRALEAAVSQGDIDTRPDDVLLGRFVADRDEAAFEALVRRHGPSVLRICRRRLGEDEAEDAFQATFIALIGHAGKVRDGESVAPWLHCVARRVAGRAGLRADRRRGREGARVDIAEVPGRGDPDGDLGPTLRAEVAGLPEKYRRAVELCYWQGLSCEQAADRLDCPAGTIKWRLSRAREILKGRIDRLGVALALLLAWLPSPRSASAALASRRGGLAGHAACARRAGEAPSESLVRRTLDVAVVIRDRSALGPGAPGRSALTTLRRGRRWAVRLGISLVVLAVILGVIAGFPPARKQAVAALVGNSYPPERTSCH